MAIIKTDLTWQFPRKLGLGLLVLVFMHGCATVQEDPFVTAEKDRVITPDSVAEVGPLLMSTAPAEKESTEKLTAEKTSQPSVSDDTDFGKSEISVTNSTGSNHQKANDSQKPAPEQLAKKSQHEGSSTNKKTEPLNRKTKESVKPHVADVLPSGGSLKGKITLKGDENDDLQPEGIIVLLEPLAKNKSEVLEKIKAHRSKTHFVDMQNKTYKPSHITISVNDKVSFINQDKIKHNVFSSTGKNAFDLGTFGTGLRRDVVLNSSGVVKVYCNIHPEMATFIGVSESGYSAVTDEKGDFLIKNILPGKYKVNIWHIRGEVNKEVTIIDDNVTLLMENIAMKKTSSMQHANKYGKKYNKNASIFDDEFY